MSDDTENDDVDQGSMADEWAAAMEAQSDVDDAMAAGAAGTGGGVATDNASPVELDEFDMADAMAAESGNVEGRPDLDVILDIPVSISMEVGRTSITIRNLLQLNQGSVIELDRLAGEPLDVLVNGTLIAHGEVVVVNEKFGIRMTDVISPSERIKRLR